MDFAKTSAIAARPLSPVSARVGYDRFVGSKFYNYQLNRWRALGDLPVADVREIGKRTKSATAGIAAFRDLARRFEREDDLYRAAFCYRGAEFLTSPTDPAKADLFSQFLDKFYASEAGQDIERELVPFRENKLAALRIRAPGGEAKGTVVALGGFDSFIEDFYLIWMRLAVAGYDVVAFEGPGQGSTFRVHGLFFDHNYEDPVAAVLDHFALTDATLLGISMGGYWAVRAAAFEPRITRLILMPPLLDWMEQAGTWTRPLVAGLMRTERLMNALIRLKMPAPPIRHLVEHANFISGGKRPLDAIKWLLAMNRDHIHAHKVTQHVLMLAGASDAFQPAFLMERQEQELTAAKSISKRIFSAEEQADQHCQIGNLPLACRVITDWLDQVR